MCGSEFNEKDIKHVTIKGKVRDICKGCVTAVKGLM